MLFLLIVEGCFVDFVGERQLSTMTFRSPRDEEKLRKPGPKGSGAGPYLHLEPKRKTMEASRKPEKLMISHHFDPHILNLQDPSREQAVDQQKYPRPGGKTPCLTHRPFPRRGHHGGSKRKGRWVKRRPWIITDRCNGNSL